MISAARRTLLQGMTSGWVALLAATSGVDAQTRDTVVIPGPQYRVGELRERLFGDSYRELWATPIRVPVLDLGAHGGGLTLLERGGGLQTKSLRFRGADGRQYVFRSVDKRPDLTNEPALQGTLVADVIQDQTSSLHPGGALVVPPLAAALGVAHVTPALFVMPDDARLGEFRAEFAGLLGLVEERPEDVADGGAPFPPFGRIIGTERLLERIEESAEDQVDARAYLTARFLDLVLNDWDRHEDQWRWGETERAGVRWWVPIPRDRDYVFVDYDGTVIGIGRNVVANAVTFGPEIDHLSGLTLNSRGIDRLFLAELDRAVWDSTAASVQARLTDALIDDAVRRIPPEFGTENPRYIAARLKSRRDDLGNAADDYYARLSSEVDVHATDERDLAVVDRVADGVVEVRLFAADDEGRPASVPYYQRRFTNDDTNEVRLFLHGGDDRAVMRGDVAESIMVRVVGGGGDDVMADSSRVTRGRVRTAFYDGRGDNQMIRGDATAVDDREFEGPAEMGGFSGETYRDWGASYSISPTVGYNGIDGPVIGGGPTYTRYGFWKEPYAYRLSAVGAIGLQTGEVEVSVQGDFRNTASRGGYSFLIAGSELDPLRFYGFGNETEDTESGRFYQVRQDRLIGQAAIYRGLPGGGTISVGPAVKYSAFKIVPGTPYAAEGDPDHYGQAGGLLSMEYDLRDNTTFPTRGLRVQLDGAAYAPVWDAESTFGRAQGTASAYWTPALPGWEPTFAVRAGGAKAWGAFPIHEAVYLGGRRSLRGYRSQRFAGDAGLFGAAEVRAPLGNYNLGLVRSDLGVIGSFDAGRVYFGSEDSDQIHTAVGGGLWMRFTVRSSVIGLTVSYAQGEEGGRAYLAFGAPF